MKKLSIHKLSIIIFVITILVSTACNLSSLPELPITPIVLMTATPNPIQGPPGPLPEMTDKPQPKEITYLGCPPVGDGGDPALNRLKNRVDEGKYVPVTFDSVLNLPWPPGVERKDRANWSTQDTAEVARYEGIPISIGGYLVEVRQQSPESTNCHGADPQFRDWHLWLVQNPQDDRSESIIAETTPRVRIDHPAWTLVVLEQIAKDKLPVRISGWLMLDPEHPDQVGKTRGTIWEIHPIMKIEVQRNGQWVSLDALGK